MRTLSQDDVRHMIGEAVVKAGSQRAFAELAGVPYQKVSIVLQGVTPPVRMLDAIGVERVVTVSYRRKK